ncbi:MAG: DNA-3-methyladenine glycosylase family protein [Gammaproteobacteria bacterium]
MNKKAHNHLLKVGNDYCPALSQIVSNNGIIEINVDKTIDVFECLAQTVVEQQVSYKAAKSIWKKVKASAASKGFDLIDYFDEKNKSSLRNDGLSQNKIKSIMGAKKAINDGLISLKKLEQLSYDDYKKLIKSLWGFGDWSAEMIAIFYLGRTNVWSDGDLMLSKGINEICLDTETSPQQLIDMVDPFQSYLALHIWRHKD